MLYNCALYNTVKEVKMDFTSKLLFLSLVALSLSIKYPDVTKNDEYPYKKFMQDTVHNCYCEPYKEGYLEGRPSYLWQYVSTNSTFVDADNLKYVLTVIFKEKSLLITKCVNWQQKVISSTHTIRHGIC